MALDESRTAGESGHLSDHNSLHDFYNAAVTAGAFDEATSTYKDTSLPPFTLDGRTTFTSRTFAGAPRTEYNRVSGRGTISKIRIRVITSSGNISVAHYTTTSQDLAGRPNTQQATSGAIACPAAGSVDVALGASTTVEEGEWYGMSCDNTTAAFVGNPSPPAANLLTGLEAQEPIHPCPAAATPGSPGGLTPVMQGVA